MPVLQCEKREGRGECERKSSDGRVRRGVLFPMVPSKEGSGPGEAV